MTSNPVECDNEQRINMRSNRRQKHTYTPNKTHIHQPVETATTNTTPKTEEPDDDDSCLPLYDSPTDEANDMSKPG